MRSDMDKVLVLKGRLGGDKKYHHRNRSKIKQLLHEEKYEAIPLRESIKPKIDWDDLKTLNENLNPLERFLEKNIGRKWDDVYSEICANINPNSAVQYHILQHLDDMVEKHAIRATNGTLFTIGWWRNLEMRTGEIYVCPETGILKKYKRKERKEQKQKEQTRYNLLDEHGNKQYNKYFEKIDGIWYYIEYDYVEHERYSKIHERIIYYRVLELVKKHQLSKKELKEFQLSNDNWNLAA